MPLHVLDFACLIHRRACACKFFNLDGIHVDPSQYIADTCEADVMHDLCAHNLMGISLRFVEQIKRTFEGWREECDDKVSSCGRPSRPPLRRRPQAV